METQTEKVDPGRLPQRDDTQAGQGSVNMADKHVERKPLLSDDSDASPGTEGGRGTEGAPVTGKWHPIGSCQEDNDISDCEPLVRREEFPHQTTNLDSIMHLLKGNIGTGILAMPSALSNSGLWVGTGGLLLIGLIATHCMHCLVHCSHVLCRKKKMPALDYGEVAEAAFEEGPRPLRRFARFAKGVVNVNLCITQFGFCIVYIIFIADNARQVAAFPTGVCVNLKLAAVFVAAVIIPYTFIRNLKHLAPFSVFANITTVIGLVIIFQWCFRGLQPVQSFPAFGSLKALPLFFGKAVYAFEGIGVVLPIENKMKTPEDFGGLSGVLNLSMVIVTVLYTAMGFYGYLRVGSNPSGSITLDLPANDWLYLSVRIIFAIAIFISYGLQFYVPVEILWPTVKRCLPEGRARSVGVYIYRAVLVLLTLGVAVTVPHLSLMISLIGAFSSSSLALIFPPILEIITRWPEMGRGKWRLWKDIVVMIFGIMGFLTGTVTTILSIIEAFRDPTRDTCLKAMNINATFPG